MESFWNKQIKNKVRFPKIKENVETDVCVIGGGLTGLSCAYYLSKKNSVLIVEREKICSSTSGKNTGKLSSGHGLFYEYLINSNGKEYAEKYLEANENAIDNIEEIIKKEHIECDFARQTSYIFTQMESKKDKIKDENRAINKIEKGKSKVVSKIDIPLKIETAIELKNQAKINPVKYAYGLANAIIKNKGEIFENSIATDIKKAGEKYEILVNDYKITANKVILATRYPTINIPGYYFLKMYQSTSYAIVADVKEKLFEGIYINSETPTISLRTINENGKELLLAVGFDYKTGTEQVEDGYYGLEKQVKQMYPNAEILYKWSAEDCISLDKIPYIGEYSNLMKNVYIATGFNKWGLTTSNIAANIINDKIIGRKNKYEDLYKSTRLDPIKNKDEVKNMLTEVKDSIILSKLKIPNKTIASIKNGEGKIVKVDGHKVGVYKSETGEVFKVKPVCSHLGCELYFNNEDKTWECPCHGSKFTYEGISVEVPSVKNLKSY